MDRLDSVRGRRTTILAATVTGPKRLAAGGETQAQAGPAVRTRRRPHSHHAASARAAKNAIAPPVPKPGMSVAVANTWNGVVAVLLPGTLSMFCPCAIEVEIAS
jgi:hypothetical protein